MLFDAACSGCRPKTPAPGPEDAAQLEFKEEAKAPAAPPSPMILPSRNDPKPLAVANPKPLEKPVDVPAPENPIRDDLVPPSNEVADGGNNDPAPSFENFDMDKELPPPPSFGDQNKFYPSAPSFPTPPTAVPNIPLNIPNVTIPTPDTVGPPPVENFNPPAGAPFPIPSTPNNNSNSDGAAINPSPSLVDVPPPPDTPPNSNPLGTAPQALLLNPSNAEGPAPDLAVKTIDTTTEAPAPANSNEPAPARDAELTVAMAEGVLGSAPESAAMGGGTNYSMLALAFPEESTEARKTKIAAGDKSYDLNLPDGQARYQAEIPLTWVYWAVTAGDFHKAVAPDGTINPEEYQKLQFGEVEQPLNGSQDGRLVRVFSCGPLTAPGVEPNWNEGWTAMYLNVLGIVPPPPTLAELCSQASYRDYRILHDKISFDLPVAGRGALIFVTFDPVKWLDASFQSVVGAKHIEGEPIPIPYENLKATIEKGELIRAVGL